MDFVYIALAAAFWLVIVALAYRGPCLQGQGGRS